ncbi:flavodoxin [Treponema sp.]|uniref:flavodoxin n=1 Tax=Treponema sp. TaxID=166 RepID=UPI00298DF8D6|nr:flavodoxin [Treponema sp.]MCQ2242399.1 flavodoxin [Treponema sp.]
MKVALIYASTTGNTEAMANAMNEALASAGAEVVFSTADSADAESVAASDVILLGSPAMGDEVLEDTMEEFYTGIEGALSGKKVGLFGSYDWGDGQWLRDWEDRARNAGANVSESLMVHLTPEADDLAKCQDWAKAFLA